MEGAQPETEHPSEPRRPGRPRDVRHDQAILDSTLEILRKQGYGGLTIDGVAAHAGVGRPTIYRRWPSKPALVVAAMVESARLAIPEIDTGTLRDDLLSVQRHQIDLMSVPENRRLTAGLIADLTADPRLAESYVRQYLEPRRAVVWRVLQRGVDRGELDAGADFALIYELLIGVLFIRSVVWGKPLGPDVAENTVDVILSAFAPKR